MNRNTSASAAGYDIPAGQSERLLAALLQHGLWGAPLETELFHGISEVTWDEIYALAGKQTVSGLAFDGMLGLPDALMPPRPLRMKWLAQLGSIEAHNERIASVLSEITTSLERAQILFFVLKGWAVAAAYPNPSHRWGGDLDLYIPQGRCTEAEYAFAGEHHGFVEHGGRHHEGTFKGISIEPHYGLVHEFRLKRYRCLERELERLLRERPAETIQLEGIPVPVPPPDFHAVFLVEHAAFHLIGGLGMRHLCDWARYLWYYRERIDRNEVTALLDRYGLRRIANAFALICIDYLGMPAGAVPFQLSAGKRARRDAAYIYREMMEGGNFGRAYAPRRLTGRPVWLRRAGSLLFILRKRRRKYAIIHPRLLWETLWLNLRHGSEQA